MLVQFFSDLRCSPSCTRGGIAGTEAVCPPDCFQYKGTLDVFYKIIHQVGALTQLDNWYWIDWLMGENYTNYLAFFYLKKVTIYSRKNEKPQGNKTQQQKKRTKNKAGTVHEKGEREHKQPKKATKSRTKQHQISQDSCKSRPSLPPQSL